MSSPMTFKEARKDFFRGAFQFSGTAARSEFCWKYVTFYLYMVLALLSVGLGLLLDAFNVPLVAIACFVISLIVLIGLLIWALVWGLPLQARRMRDSGQNPWLLLVIYVVAGVIGAFDSSGVASNTIHIALFIYLCAAQTKLDDEIT